jgi:hypothetical protein
LKRVTANRVSMYAGIVTVPPAMAWYVSSVQSVAQGLRATPGSVWPDIFAALAITSLVTMLIANAVAHSRFERLFKRQADKQDTGSATSTAQVKNVDEFYKTYSSRMLNETEDLVIKESDQYQSGRDRERYLTRLAAMLTTLLIFERAWLTIYGSQIKLLHDLNTGGVKTHDQVRAYYDQGAQAYPDHYKTVSFDQWTGYLKSWLLIRDYDVAHVEITIRGQDFLRYLVESRYDAALRLG